MWGRQCVFYFRFATKAWGPYMKDSKSPGITGAELRVLEELWRRGAATIRDLTDALYPGDSGKSKFATVQKLLMRLVAKHLVRRRSQRETLVFEAAVARDALIGGELRRVADRLGGQSMAPLLTYLVESGDLSAGERAHLRKLLEEPARDKPSSHNRKSWRT